MTIVLDTNCLPQIIPRNAKHRWLFDLIKTGAIRLAVTTEILAEYEEQLSQFYSATVADNTLQLLGALDNVVRITIYYRWWLIVQDPDDNKFTDCAVAARANYLITYDRHFRVLDQIDFPKIPYMTIEQFQTILSK